MADLSFDHYRRDSLNVVDGLVSAAEVIEEATELCWTAIAAGGTIFWCGNGGSAAEAQHMAAELVGRFSLERSPIRSVALTTDSSALTALSNDYSFETVFERQVLALVRPGDVLIGLSTSGSSLNVVAALKAARQVGAQSVALTGRGMSACSAQADVAVPVDSSVTSHIQEAHLLIGHYLCKVLEERWASLQSERTSA